VPNRRPASRPAGGAHMGDGEDEITEREATVLLADFATV
jgi:hypothetical protein